MSRFSADSTVIAPTRSRVLRASVALLATVALLAAFGCSGKSASSTSETQSPSTAPSQQTPAASAGATESFSDVTALKVEDVKVGDGAEAKAGDTVTVNYTGWLTDGTKFDSSLDSGQPFQFQLGSGMVIPGWDQGVAGMKVGGTRVLVIPADLGYGAQGAGGVIPPNATLKFQVELLDVQPAAQ